MRIKKNVNLGIISRSNTKFSDLTYRNCMVDSKEKEKFDLGVKRLMYHNKTYYSSTSFQSPATLR